MAKKIVEHPSTRFHREIEALSKEIQALKIDVAILKDLLSRTIRMLARAELKGLLKLSE